ncbi:hypothetical protein CCMA1212_008002 [Trichoderma ghanense]|uniref:Uncharacterized protein n=1 Tax=Trichoderma ghanense TaxID=65468 RepID=A0ABY2GWQ3_9HYPO
MRQQREGKQNSGSRPSPLIFTFFLLVGLAATELRMGRLWAASGSCRINHFHHSSSRLRQPL